MQLGTFTANIIIDSRALVEYGVAYESPTRATCWVASEEGKSFGVQWKCHEERRVTAFRGDVNVDGISCGRILNSPGVLDDRDDACLFDTLFDDKVERGLMFSRVQLSDDDSLLNKELPECLGEIILEIERGDIISLRRPAGQERRTVVENTDTFRGRCKEATVHRVGFGPERVRKLDPIVWDLRRNSEPTITFVFRYLPLSVLQALNCVAPRPTSTNSSTGSSLNSSPAVGSPDNYNALDIKLAQMNGWIQKLTDRVHNLENELPVKRLRGPQADTSEDRKPKRIKTEDLGNEGGLNRSQRGH